MRCFSCASSSGTNLLKSGAIQIGYTVRITRLNATQISHAYSHHSSPARSITHRMHASSGMPSAAAISAFFSASTMNMRGVILLKPKRCSMPNVRYQANGRSSTLVAAPSSTSKATPRRTPGSNQPAVSSNSHCKAPPNVSARIRATSKTVVSMPRRVFAQL